MSKLSKIEKKKRVKIIQAKERAEVISSMPLSPSGLDALLDHLDSELKSCDHTTKMTKDFLKSERMEVEKVISWLAERGGYCDCEVLANLDDLSKSFKERLQRNIVRPKKEKKESRCLKAVAGFDLSSLPKPWRIANLYNHEESVEIQLGKKRGCNIKVVEEPLPVGDKTSSVYWENLWCSRTELTPKGVVITLFDAIAVPVGFCSVCVSTESWIPVLCWVFRDSSSSYIEVRTELSRQKGDLLEVEKLMEYLENKKA